MPKTPKNDKKADVKYPEEKVYFKVGDKAMTFEEAKKYLGWKEDTPEEQFTEFDLELPNGRRVVFDNNKHNRPWNSMQLKVLKQEHLNRNWRLNPDGIGIGKTGQIMSAQHRLRTFCEAEIERQSDPAKWGDEPLVMPCIVVVGLDESDETFRILNTGAPATAADAFYRQQLFPRQTKPNRVALCKMLEGAIRTLRVRTGEDKDAYTCNSEVVDFYERHPKTADCVLHIFEEYASGAGHSKRMNPGTAAALMWLMACSATASRDKWVKKPCDKSLDWSLDEKASDFWTMLCKGEDQFEIVRNMLDSLCSEDEPLAGLYERKLVVTKAWNLYRGGKAITEEGIALKTTGEGAAVTLDEFPDLGGIDRNEGTGSINSEAGDPPADPEQVEAAKAEVAEAKAAPAAEPEPVDEERALLTKLRVEHRNKILLFVPTGKNKDILVWEEDATLFKNLLKLEPKTFPNGLKCVGYPYKKKDDLLAKLKAAKKKAVWVTVKDGEPTLVEDAI